MLDELPASTVTLNNSTVVHNHVDAGDDGDGGAIWGSPQDHLTLRNSIVFGNSPQPELYGFGSGQPLIRYSDVCGEKGGPPAPASAHNVCQNPRLTTSGAETSESPTLDAGLNALVPKGVTSDIAGHKRIRANLLTCGAKPVAIVDMGAFEFTGHGPAPPCAPRVSRVAIGHGPLNVSHHQTKVKLSCEGLSRRCTGAVAIKTVKRFPSGKSGKRQRLVLGTAHYRLRTGGHLTLVVRLSTRALAKLTGLSSVRVSVHASDGDSSAFRTVTLKLG